MSYRKLEIWQRAHELVIDIHKMTLKDLPKFELYEVGSQIRRSIKSTKSTIVEGYGRRKYKAELSRLPAQTKLMPSGYKQDYIRFLTYSIASCDETAAHLETLYETDSLNDETIYKNLMDRLQTLGKKINRFIQGVEKEHKT